MLFLVFLIRIASLMPLVLQSDYLSTNLVSSYDYVESCYLCVTDFGGGSRKVANKTRGGPYLN